ncbi:L,D-transpeptidase [Atopobacter sp. AH10]|uniref:L,D-transpeptidase n=1 Tax=Atopobacter sp. AH10 TaxID=2315861 RepID=UPI0013149420|nr:L,D-transpeptidase [Atopobacter sp. AH10]
MAYVNKNHFNNKSYISFALVTLFSCAMLLAIYFLFHSSGQVDSLVKHSSSTIAQPLSRLDNIHHNRQAVQLWNRPSETSYPDIPDWSKVKIDVSIKDQRVYIKENNKTVYSIICSSGDSANGYKTPTGQFKIEDEHGDFFVEPDTRYSAYHWVSFKDHGVFLFHSMVMWNKHQVVLKEALRLGQEASHGCIRLPEPDAKWLFDHIKPGTSVTVK